MWADSGIGVPATFMWQDMLDRPEREHDEAERRVGGVETVGAIHDEPHAPIEAFVPGIGPHRQMRPMPRMWLIGSWSV